MNLVRAHLNAHARAQSMRSDPRNIPHFISSRRKTILPRCTRKSHFSGARLTFFRVRRVRPCAPLMSTFLTKGRICIQIEMEKGSSMSAICYYNYYYATGKRHYRGITLARKNDVGCNMLRIAR